MNAIQKVGGELMRAALTFSYIGPNAQLNVYMGIYDLNSSQYITGEVQSFNTPGSGTYTANLSALVAPDLPVGSYLGAVFQVVAQANNLVISNPNPYQAPDAWIVAG